MGEALPAPLPHPAKFWSSFERREKSRKASSIHDQSQSIQGSFQVFSDGKIILMYQLLLPLRYYLLQLHKTNVE